MTQVLIVVGALVAIGLLVYYIKRRNVDPFWYPTPVTRGFKLINEVAPITTPERVFVHYEPGVAGVSHDAIDRGVRNVFEKALCSYPEVDRSTHLIRVVVLQGELSPEARTPCFRVAINHNNPYWNTEYDMMRGSSKSVHYVLAAGQLLSIGTPYGDSILIPSSQDAVFIELITDFELEHALLAKYDGQRYEETQIHGNGQGHPIIPSCDGHLSRSFMVEGASLKFEGDEGELWLVK